MRQERKAQARDNAEARRESEGIRFVELLSGDATSSECFHAIKRGVGARHIHGSIIDGWANVPIDKLIT